MANLYVFHQELDGPLWYSVFDGTYWTADFQAPNIRMSAAPSAISWGDANDEFHNDIIIFHQGSHYNARLWGTNFEEGIGLAGEISKLRTYMCRTCRRRSSTMACFMSSSRRKVTDGFGTRFSMAQTGRQIR